jgi:nitroreductase
MPDNPVIEAMLNRKSIRKYKEDVPTDDIIEKIVRAGQQAPFASQLCSLLFSRDREKIPFNAPLSFIFCVDFHKMEKIMRKRNWNTISNDMWILIMGLQDGSLMGENMVIAAESLGLGSCYIGMIPYMAKQIRKQYKLPKRVFPFVQLVMGYPAEDPPPRPRYPLDFVLFEDEYPELDDEKLSRAMKVMDEGYMAQDYYSAEKIMIKLIRGRKETYDYDTYSWTEHISRKWGQWFEPQNRLLRQLRECGFNIGSHPEEIKAD